MQYNEVSWPQGKQKQQITCFEKTLKNTITKNWWNQITDVTSEPNSPAAKQRLSDERCITKATIFPDYISLGPATESQ